MILRNDFYWSLYDIISNGNYLLNDKVLLLFKLLNKTEDGWPRLVYSLSSVMSFLFANKAFVIYISTTFYLVVLIIAVYLIGKECCDKQAGIMAAFLVSFYPAIFGLSRSFGLDLPLSSASALAIFLLLKVDIFRNRKYSLFFGLIFGIGILVKGQIIFFIIGPLFYSLFKLFILRNEQYFKKSCLNLFIALGSAIIVSSLFWYNNLGIIMPALLNTTFSDLEAHDFLYLGKTFSFKWLFFYLFGTMLNISGPYFLLFILMFHPFLKAKIKHKGILMSWLAVPYVLFTFIIVKSLRYYLPSFPVIALITSIGIFNFSTYKRKMIIASVVLFGLGNFFYVSYISKSLLTRLVHYWNKAENFYQEKGPLFYSVRRPNVFPDMENFISTNMYKNFITTQGRIKIAGYIPESTQEIDKYSFCGLIAMLGIDNPVDIYRGDIDKNDYDFLIVLIKDTDIHRVIKKLATINPNLHYVPCGQPYKFYPEYESGNFKFSNFIFILKKGEDKKTAIYTPKNPLLLGTLSGWHKTS